MTIEKIELLEKLKNLKELSRTKNFRLVKPEKDEAVSVLSTLCELDTDNFADMMDALPEFSSDIVVHVITSCWNIINKRSEFIYQQLQGFKFSNDRGNRLRLSLALELLERDPRGSLRILSDVCQGMKSTQKRIPNIKDLETINSALRGINIESLSNLPLDEAPVIRVLTIIIYLLSAGFVFRNKGKSPHSTGAQFAFLRWANSYSALTELPEDLSKAISESVQKWNIDSLKRLRTEIDSFNAVFRKLLDPILQNLRESLPITEETPSTVVPLTEGTEPLSKIHLPQSEYDALYEIERLANHIKNNQSLLFNTKSELAHVQEDLNNIRSELKIALYELENFKSLLVNEQEKVRNISEEKDVLIKKIESQEVLEDKIKKLVEADARHQETVKSYEQQLDHFSERINKEGVHRLKAFCMQLGDKLQPFIVNLNEAEKMEMTLELGNAMRTQVKNLIWLLSNMGIKIEGEH